MLRKVYAYPGKVEANVLVNTGMTTLRINFTNGRLDRKNGRPATYATTNLAIMAIIEGSIQFRSGSILLHSVTGQVEPVPTASVAEPKKETKVATKVAEEKAPTEVVEHPEVTTMAEAAAILKELGAGYRTLQTIASIQRTAKQYNVSFPNLSNE